MLEVNELSCQINAQKIFAEINFSVRPGELLLLKGKSGSGKSSILNTLMGIIPEHISGNIQGEITYLGKSLLDLTVLERAGTIGYLHQDPDTQLCTTTVADELVFGMENLGFSNTKIRQRLGRIIDFFALHSLLTKDLNALSGGEKQLISLAATYAMDPDIFLLDEPTANLDVENSSKIAKLISEIAKKENKIVVLVEHNLSYFKPYIDSIFDVDQGKMLDKAIAFEIDRYERGFKIPVLTSQFGEERVLTVQNLKYAYSGKCLWEGINFSLFKGQVLGLTGKNGVGKTTLVNCLTGLDQKYAGIIEYQGQSIKGMSVYQLGQNIGLVFQNPENQFIKLTVEEELKLSIHNRHRVYSRSEGQLDHYLEKFALTDYRYANPYQLSQGQKRRLSTASMLINGQQILILDEPTYGQDRENLRELLLILYEIIQHGVSIIMISHDQEVLRHACHSILQIRGQTSHYFAKALDYFESWRQQ